MKRLAAPSVVFVLLSACAGRAATPVSLPAMPFATDTLRSELLRPGVTRRYLHAPAGPWAIHVLEVALDQCYRAVAVKGATGAHGREKTSALLGDLARGETVIGGVNADFFLFTPSGVPQGALITRGRVVTGPSDRPVLAFDSSGAPRLTVLSTKGEALVRGRRYGLAGWNRAAPSGLAWFDGAWGRALDTLTGAVEVEVEVEGTVLRVDTGTAGASIPSRGGVLLAGPGAPAELRAALIALGPGDKVPVRVSLAPLHPLEAVGGRPILLADSVIAPVDDASGQPGFARTRHPRTAVGIARGGKRLLLVVVDGRQPPYSDGMSLRELAELLLALGARDAINLDGGGSTTLVYADPVEGGALKLANRPSDSAGERPVGDALAIVQGCGRR